MNPLIFVHIPKTAGTSFRNSVAKIYSDKKFLQDYGQNSPETTKKVLNEVYLKNNLYGLLDEQVKVIGGHFLAKKYINISNLKNIVTFLRDPVKRVISEYRHKQRIEDYQGSILEFAEMPTNRNMMAHYLKTIPIEAVGFIGIAERYEQSLELFNKNYGLKVKVQHLNAALEVKDKHREIYSEELQRIAEFNAIDFAIYNASLTNFDWRYRLECKNIAFVHGMWRFDKKHKKVTGYAFSYDCEQPVFLSISKKEEVIAEVSANRFFAIIHRFRGPRRGYVGFSIDVDIDDATDISCAVTATGQPILKMLEC
ncbi:MAG: hypothetical protein ACI88A_004337 [Paraglaciecola sp.]|jgi:hypothetical protein